MSRFEYDESWNVFFDRKKEKWLRVPAGDPRSTHQLCVKGCAIDFNYPIDNYPQAPALTDAERRRVEEENASFFKARKAAG
jgi:hypothetical protein